MKKLLLAICIVLSWITAAPAQTGGISANDPFIYSIITGTIPDYKYTLGLTHSSSVVAAYPSAAVIVTMGQSLWANTVPGSYSTVNATAQQFNINDGAIYPCTGQVLGTSDSSAGLGSSSVNCPFVDGLVTNAVFPRAIVAAMAVDGTGSAQWNGPDLGSKIVAMWNRLVALGHPPDFILWHQGEADVQLGTPAATYTTNVQNVARQWRALGYTGPFLVAQETMVTFVTDPTIRAAQAATVNASLCIVLGSDIDTLGGANRQADGVHLSNAGALAAAALDIALITARKAAPNPCL